MDIKGRMIGLKYYEAKVNEIETGTLDKKEALQFASMLLLEAESIARYFDETQVGKSIAIAVEELHSRCF